MNGRDKKRGIEWKVVPQLSYPGMSQDFLAPINWNFQALRQRLGPYLSISLRPRITPSKRAIPQSLEELANSGTLDSSAKLFRE